jgi:hypothetical protein
MDKKGGATNLLSTAQSKEMKTNKKSIFFASGR